MKISLVLVLIMFLFSCMDAPPQSQIDETKIQVGVISNKEIYVYTIDSCEYVGSIRWRDNDVIAHKGNCKYCAARNNKPCK